MVEILAEIRFEEAEVITLLGPSVMVLFASVLLVGCRQGRRRYLVDQ
jgi:hypothetical protein